MSAAGRGPARAGRAAVTTVAGPRRAARRIVAAVWFVAAAPAVARGFVAATIAGVGSGIARRAVIATAIPLDRTHRIKAGRFAAATPGQHTERIAAIHPASLAALRFATTHAECGVVGRALPRQNQWWHRARLEGEAAERPRRAIARVAVAERV